MDNRNNQNSNNINTKNIMNYLYDDQFIILIN